MDDDIATVKNGVITAVNTGKTTIYAKVCDSDIEEAVVVTVIPDLTNKKHFTTTADSGYYAETADSEEKIGAISFNSVFDLGADYSVNMSEYGFDLFKDGSEDNKKTLSSDSETEFTGGMVKFYATIENIPSTDFDVELSAIPYVVIDGKTYTGNVCVYTVTQGGKWLGTNVD